MKRLFVFILLLASLTALNAQVAGTTSLAVLDMPASGRAAGVGFDYLSLYDDDVTLTLNNPSLIDARCDNQLTVGLVNLFSGANFGTVGFSKNFKHLGAFTFGLMFDNYGRFDGYDAEGVETGSFTAADYLFSIGWGRALDEHVSIGANFKPVLSQYESYTAFAFGIDLAATYMSTDHAFAATVMGRNIGAQICTFNGITEHLPFEISIVGSYKLHDAPFRLMFALNEMQQWQLAYEDPLNPSVIVDPFTGQVTQPSSFERFADNLFRHVGVGVELQVKRVFFARLGYNYRQMREMKAADVFNLSGFSIGLGLEVKGFKFCYSRNNYHLTQAPNFISITTDLSRFFN